MYIIHMGIQFKYVCVLNYIVLIQHFENKEIGKILLAKSHTQLESKIIWLTKAQVQQGPTYVCS